MRVSCHWSSKLECLFPFFFYPFEHWKLYYDDMHVLVWLCASQCATFLYQTHLRACCVPGSRLSAFCGLLLILIITFQGKYFHHRMEKPRLKRLSICSQISQLNSYKWELYIFSIYKQKTNQRPKDIFNKLKGKKQNSKNKTRSWLWLRSWTPYCQIQTEIEENGENH